MEVLGDILERGAKIYSDREAIVFSNTRLTYRQFNERVNRLAHYLLSLNLQGFKSVSILAENCHQYCEVYFGVGKAGYVTVPLNFRLSTREMAEIIKDGESKALFFEKAFASQVRELAELTGVNTLICIDDRIESSEYYEDLLERFPATNPEVEVDENQMAILMYTGGTTGKAKGVMISHRNLMTSIFNCIATFNIYGIASTCFVLPFYHVSWWPVPYILAIGGKVAVVHRPDLAEIMKTIQDEKCEWINAVPTIYNWMLQHPDLVKYDLSSLKIISYAGSPISPEVLSKLIAKFGNIFMQIYGMTEAIGGTVLLPEDHVGERLKSCGRSMLAAKVRVVNSDEKDVQPGEVGEIICKGKHVMQGYWKNPELTAKTIVDGWMHTGDMATVDEDGYIYIMDRKNDMIITGGENVYPKEVEDVLYQHPAVMETCVFGVPDDKWGESVKAVVVLKTDQTISEGELIQFCRQRLAGYKCPKSVEFRQALPKSPVGKILRSEIKKEYWQGRDRNIS